MSKAQNEDNNQEPAEQTPGKKEHTKIRVLIVDDNRADRTLCRELIQRVCECSVVESSTVAESM